MIEERLINFSRKSPTILIPLDEAGNEILPTDKESKHGKEPITFLNPEIYNVPRRRLTKPPTGKVITQEDMEREKSKESIKDILKDILGDKPEAQPKAKPKEIVKKVPKKRVKKVQKKTEKKSSEAEIKRLLEEYLK